MKSIKLPKNPARRGNKFDQFVFSSRVRVARNLEGLKFPDRLSDKDMFDIDENLSDSVDRLPDEIKIEIENLDDMHRDKIMALVGNNVITEDFLKGGRKLAYEENGDWVILINEDDHFRIFSLETGFNIKKMYNRVSKIVGLMEKDVDFAFDESLGYLSSSIINVGTGLRITCIVNLYGLVSTRKIDELIDNASSIGYSIVNATGNSTDSGLFYLYNIYSLGISEEEMLDEYQNFLEHLYSLEMEARDNLFSDPDELELSIEEIFELDAKEEIEWSDMLYYIGLIDAMNKRHLTIEDKENFRDLIFDMTDTSLLYGQMVELEKIAGVRMDQLREHLRRIKYKTVKRV